VYKIIQKARTSNQIGSVGAAALAKAWEQKETVQFGLGRDL